MDLRKYWFWILLICASCSNPSSTEEERAPDNWADKLGFTSEVDVYLQAMGQSAGNLGEPFSDLKMKANADKAQVSIPFSPADSSYYNLELVWVNDEVASINIDVFSKDYSQTAAIFSDLKSYYQRQYGAGGEAEDYAVWYSTSEAGKDVEISLLDESENYGKPYIAIIYFQEEGIAD